MNKVVPLSLLIITSLILSGIVLAEPGIIGIKKENPTEIITNQQTIEQYNNSLLSSNQTSYVEPQSSEEEIIAIAENYSVTQEWIDKHPYYNVFTFYDYYSTWIVEFTATPASSNAFYSKNSWEKIGLLQSASTIDYLDIYIDDKTHEILYYESYSEPLWESNNTYGTSKHDEKEILSVLSNYEPLNQFLASYPEANYFLSYYEGYWEVYFDFFGQNFTDYHYMLILIDDLSLQVLMVYSNVQTSLTKLTVQEATTIASQYPGIPEFLENQTYHVYASYLWWTYENSSDAVWEVAFYLGNDLSVIDSFEGEFNQEIAQYFYYYFDYAAIYIMDSNASVIDAIIPTPATMSEKEILAITANITSIQEFLDKIPGAQNETYYDPYSQTWYVGFSSTIIIGAYAYVIIDDLTGQVIDYKVNYPDKLPKSNYAQILVIAESSNVFQQISDYGPFNFSVFFLDGYWYVYLYSPVYIEAYAYLVINDETQSIEYSEYGVPPVSPTMTPEQAISIAEQLEEVQEFKQNYSGVKTSVYYYDGQWQVIYHTPNWEHAYYVVIDDATQKIVDHGLLNGNYYEG